MTLAPVINCYTCDRVYRMDRDCPNCARRQAREARRTQQRKPPTPAKQPRRTSTFTEHIASYPNVLGWFRRQHHLDTIEAAWPALRARLNKYHLTTLEWARLVVQVNSSCQICRDPHPPLKLHIDHDHHNGQIRGLLCNRCNTGIGMLRIDGPEGERRAAAVRAYIGRSFGSTGILAPEQITTSDACNPYASRVQSTLPAVGHAQGR